MKDDVKTIYAGVLDALWKFNPVVLHSLLLSLLGLTDMKLSWVVLHPQCSHVMTSALVFQLMTAL